MKLYDLLQLISLDAKIDIKDWTGEEHEKLFEGKIEDLDIFLDIEKYKNYKVICLDSYNSKIIIDVIEVN